MSARNTAGTALGSLTALLLVAACGDDDGGPAAPVLTPEPAGAPTAIAEGRLSCLGRNAPPDPEGSNLTLPGWIRAWADPTNSGMMQPEARVEAFTSGGVSLGESFSDTRTGRLALNVPIPPTGFEGTVVAEADGFVTTRFFSSRAVTNTDVAGWAWMVTPAERDSIATDAGVSQAAGSGIVVGAIHDCDVFGVANAVIRFGGSTSGVVFFSDFAPAPERTFSDVSGRFAIANVPPGPLTVEAFGRTEAGGPLVLLSRADIDVQADVITSVDLQPRVGAER